jgi:hypothetical protein
VQLPAAQSPQQAPVQWSQQAQVAALCCNVVVVLASAIAGSAKATRQSTSRNFDFIVVISSEFQLGGDTAPRRGSPAAMRTPPYAS